MIFVITDNYDVLSKRRQLRNLYFLPSSFVGKDNQIWQGGWILTMREDVCLPVEADRKIISWGSMHFFENLFFVN